MITDLSCMMEIPMTDETSPNSRQRRSVLDMPGDEFRELGHALVNQIADFYDSFGERALTRVSDAGDIKAMLGTDQLPEQGIDAGTLLSEIAPLMFDHSLHNGHPKFFGYITSSGAPLGALADLLAAAVNSNVGKRDLSPVASEIEAQAVRWLADLIDYSQDSGGLMVSGGNMANFLAFVAARTAKAPWDLRKEGNYGDDRHLTAYVSVETHTWVQKAADVCGLGADGIRWIDTDAEGRMDVERLREQLDADRKDGRLPFLVVATAGSVSTGVVDPIRELAALCEEQDLWLHADGAYGAPAAVVSEAPDDLHALALVDSVALDPHKWLYCPIEAACVLTRHPSALQEAFGFYPEYYLFDSERETGIDYYEIGMQNSRGFRALKVWLALRNAGREGYREAIGTDIDLARTLYELAEAHPELSAHSINLSIATFRYVPTDIPDDGTEEDYLNDLNRALLAEIQAGGDFYVSNAIVGNKYLLRACIVNFRTLQQDIEAIPGLVVAAGRRFHEQMRGASNTRG
jgi:glutamate/tyrosine decarboxylase-like PLP-dependent enzyme